MNKVRHFFLNNTEILLYVICWAFHAGFALLSNYYDYQLISAYSTSVSFIYATFILLFANIHSKSAFFTFFYFEMLIYSIILTLSTGTDFGGSIICICVIPLLFLATINQQHKKSFYIVRIVSAIAGILFVLWWSQIHTGQLPYSVTQTLTQHQGFFVSHLILTTLVMAFFLFYYCMLTEHALVRSHRKTASQVEALSYMVNHDQLTGLINRRKITALLQKAYAENESTGSVFTFTIFDIDNFKHINDSYGHDAGDAILQNVTALLAKHLQPNQLLARWGGEEFVILFPEAMEKALPQLEALRKLTAEHTFRWQYTDIRLSLTFGVSSSNEYDSLSQIMIAADKRLMYGKQTGKNKIVTQTERG